MSYETIAERLNKKGVVVIDGGTGTELERRGVPATPGAWCGPASIEHFDVLVEIHMDYIKAGAEIITTNTYASNRLMLNEAGLGDQFSQINESAVAAALRSRREMDREDVLVAGCLSHMCPVSPGTSAWDPSKMPSKQAMSDAFGEMADLQKAAGCEAIFLEMMYCPRRMPIAFAAAAETGLPVWAGFSARRHDDGRLLSFDQVDDIPFEVLLGILDQFEVDAAGIMHTSPNITADALQVLRSKFSGPMTAYPDSGYFKMPDWQFDNIIPPNELRDYAEQWIEEGVQVVGGCCGLSPEHIAALTALKR